MDKSVKAIFSALSPIELVCSMGLSAKEHKGNYITQCPCCGNSLFVLQYSFVCSNYGCAFRAGSIVEFMAFSEKKPLRKSLDSCLQLIKDKSKYVFDADEIDRIYTSILFQRQLFDFFLRLSHTSNTGQISTIRHAGALNRNGIAHSALKSSVFILTKTDLVKLNSILKSNNLDTYLPGDSNAAIVMPYFSNHHSISDLLVVSQVNKQPTRIKILPTKLAWFGLLQMHPACKDIDISMSYADSMVINSDNARITPDKMCLHYLYNPTTPEIGWLPDKSTFILEEHPDEHLSAIACLRQVMPNINVMDHKGNIYDSRTFTINYCASVLEREGLSANARLIMESSRITAEDREVIARRLHDRKKFALAQDVLKLFKTQMVYHDEHSELYESSDGYFVNRGNSGVKTYVTNFTMTVLDNIVFADTLDVYHRVNVNVMGKEYVTLMRPQDIDKSSEIELSVRRKHEDNISDSALPTIREKSQIRVVSSYLRHQISKAPQVEGTPFLGWNGHRTRFFGPFFYMDETTSKTWEPVFHPVIGDMGSYSTKTQFARVFSESLPLEITRIIGQAVAFIARYYLNIAVKPIPIHNNKNGRVLIESLFEAIGQTKPVQINFNVRQKELPGLHGYPAYSTADTKNDIVNLQYPLFILCDGGEMITQEYKSEVIKEAAQVFRYIVYNVVEWIIKTKAKSYDKMASVNYPDAYAAEGSAIICEVCQISKWIDKGSEFKHLEAFLSKVSFDRAGECITHDLAKHIVTLDLSERPDINLQSLHDELTKLGASYVHIEGSKISSDSISLLTSIEQFYQKKPQLTEVFDVNDLMVVDS